MAPLQVARMVLEARDRQRQRLLLARDAAQFLQLGKDVALGVVAERIGIAEALIVAIFGELRLVDRQFRAIIIVLAAQWLALVERARRSAQRHIRALLLRRHQPFDPLDPRHALRFMLAREIFVVQRHCVDQEGIGTGADIVIARLEAAALRHIGDHRAVVGIADEETLVGLLVAVGIDGVDAVQYLRRILVHEIDDVLVEPGEEQIVQAVGALRLEGGDVQRLRLGERRPVLAHRQFDRAAAHRRGEFGGAPEIAAARLAQHGSAALDPFVIVRPGRRPVPVIRVEFDRAVARFRLRDPLFELLLIGGVARLLHHRLARRRLPADRVERHQPLEEAPVVEQEHEARLGDRQPRHLDERNLLDQVLPPERRVRRLLRRGSVLHRRRQPLEQLFGVRCQAVLDEGPEALPLPARIGHLQPVERRDRPARIGLLRRGVRFAAQIGVQRRHGVARFAYLRLQRKFLGRRQLLQQRKEIIGRRPITAALAGMRGIMVAEAHVIAERAIVVREPEAAESHGAGVAETLGRRAIGHPLGRPCDLGGGMEGQRLGRADRLARRLGVLALRAGRGEQHLLHLAQHLAVGDVVEQRVDRVAQRLRRHVHALHTLEQPVIEPLARPASGRGDAFGRDIERQRPVERPVLRLFVGLRRLASARRHRPPCSSAAAFASARKLS
ncbi:MAG TPA: hypothetical protein PKD48_07300 [Sphingopyxis sp.]|nr:hypothetical protein [Sphingopyxis sp.]HMQ20148.1 hypothetical protein [Sphingopyxis sp.]